MAKTLYTSLIYGFLIAVSLLHF